MSMQVKPSSLSLKFPLQEHVYPSEENSSDNRLIQRPYIGSQSLVTDWAHSSISSQSLPKNSKNVFLFKQVQGL